MGVGSGGISKELNAGGLAGIGEAVVFWKSGEESEQRRRLWKSLED